jgi:hypothetical protein
VSHFLNGVAATHGGLLVSTFGSCA